MKNSWLIWVFVIGIIATVFFAFNYQKQQSGVPLTEIFPDEETYPVDIEYEFVDETGEEIPVVAERSATGSGLDLENIPQEVRVQPIVDVAGAQDTRPRVSQIGSPVQSEPAARTAVTGTPAQNEASPAVEQAIVDIRKGPDVTNIPFTIQVASFRKKSMAIEAFKKIRDRNPGAFVVEKNLGAKGIWYRIYIGEFQTKEAAQSRLTQLKNDFSGSFIISPR